MSSMLGGVFGALLMGLTLPLLRPIMLYIGSPELLAFAALGISMVAVLSGNAPLRGLTAAGFGIMVAMIGSDPQTGTLRWTMDTLYLWEGLPLVPVVLGLFALPELCDLAIARSSVARAAKIRRHRPACGAARRTASRIGGWCCAAAGSERPWARCPASAPR